MRIRRLGAYDDKVTVLRGGGKQVHGWTKKNKEFKRRKEALFEEYDRKAADSIINLIGNRE